MDKLMIKMQLLEYLEEWSD